jgi:hypothetical protein
MYFKNLIELLEIKREETLPSEENLDLPKCIFLYLKEKNIKNRQEQETVRQNIEIPDDFLTKNDNSEEVIEYFNNEISIINNYIKDNTIIVISRGILNENERKLLLNFINNENLSNIKLVPESSNGNFVSIHINRYNFEKIFVNISKIQLEKNLNKFKENDTKNNREKYGNIVVNDQFIDKIYISL